MKTLIKQDNQVLYHPEFDDYGTLQIFRIDGNEPTICLVKELIPHKTNILQKIIIGYKQINTAFTLWRKRQNHSLEKFWCLL
jgi:hypothetical protein